jgi:hypothetical protein
LTRREALEVTDDEKDLVPVAPRQRRDNEPLVAGPSDRRDEAFLLEAMQGTAHRRSAEAHARDDGALGDACSRRQLAGDDERAKLVVNARDVIRRRVRCAVSGV